MFLHYYGLREQPFGVTPNPRYLYHGPAHREALASLIYGIEADLGFAALIAEPGMGKTTLLFYLLEKFRPTARTALVFQTQCTPLELLRYVANELEVEAEEDDPVVLNDRIRQTLVREARARRRVVLIVDEAQNLSEESLEAIRLLSDFETPDFKLLHIILAGQPRLAEKLAHPSLSQLLQRIAMLNRLLPFTALEDVGRYISYRLKVAGYSGPPIFTQDGLALIAKHSGGIPRQINRLCFNALSLGCVTKKRQIDAEIMREVVHDLDLQLLMPSGSTFPDPDEHPEAEADKSTEERRSSFDTDRKQTFRVPVPRATSGPRPQPEVLAGAVPSMAPPLVRRHETEGALALAPVATSVRMEPEPALSAWQQAKPKVVARPQVAPSSTQKPGPSAQNTRQSSKAKHAAIDNRRMTARAVRPAPNRNDRLSLVLIVLCVIAVPLLALAAWRYAERQHLLPAPEQPASPTSVETSPGEVQSGRSVNLPSTTPSQQKPRKQPPRSELRLGPTSTLSTTSDARRDFDGIELRPASQCYANLADRNIGSVAIPT